MNSPTFKKLINDLIRAYEAIKNENPNERLLSFGEYSRDDIFRTTYFILKSQFPAFKKITKQEFEELPTDDKITALHEILNNPQGATLPKDLEEMLQNYDERPVGEASHNEINYEAAMQTPVARFRRMLRSSLNSMEVNEAVDRVVPPTPAPIEAKQVESIQILLQNPVLKEEFDDKLPKKISEKTKTSPTKSQEIARFFEEYITEVPSQQEAAGIDTNYIETLPANQPIIFENVLAKEAAEIPVEPLLVGGFWAGPIGRTYIQVGIDEIAKDDPLTAAALKTNRHTKELRRAIIEMNGNPELVNILEGRIKELQTRQGRLPDALEIATITSDLPFTDEQLQLISAQSTGVMSYSFYNQAFVPKRSFVGNIFYGGIQQAFGKSSRNFIDRSIRRALTSAAKKAGKEIVGKVASSAILASVSGALTSASVFISNAVPIIGPIIVLLAKKIVGWIVSILVQKIIPWIKKNYRLIVGGLIGGTVGYGLLGAAGALAGGAVVGGLAAGVNFGAIALFLGALISTIFAAIAIPLAIAFIVIPISVALIIFIINSGAYIVPPGAPIGDLATSGLTGVTQVISSPYIDVIKTASPAGPFENGDGALKNITYKVTVRAKKGSLKNIKFTNTCQVIAKVGKPTCTAPLPKTEDMPEVIDPGKNYEFSYTMDLSSFTDAFVVDTFNVTADASEKTGAVSAASASVKIGTPPESCPSGWPVDPPIAITQRPQGTYSHSGYEAIDIAKNAGSPVYATHTGVVIALNWGGVSYGLHVRINSNCGGKNFQSVYGHLQHVLVTTGQVVAAGQIIGTIDSTGNSDGNHLHYEFRPIVTATASNDGPVPLSQEPIRMAPPYIPNL